MILSKASFFHRKYLRLYTNEMPASLKEYVKRNKNCEDIAMSFLVANATGAPLIWAKVWEAIATKGLNVSEFGRMPLIPTTVKVVDSRGTWWFW
ncbi:EXTL2, alpha-1,4-N-acetylhexosaminyltransferase [Cynara cardunculus var. scolymus]|uniref:EXTL2, alpha-1,4-N-acetylhexosaminyltransferase n=1 Tax=Cynara cardunculus var. scolymus TaxID=59895 RepID=A0A118K0D9_CYNCS|nr:EXTL2, alpha-1,4-N-acetylhexosaminyltransferase [Cynara cardunculus var. scolymus]